MSDYKKIFFYFASILITFFLVNFIFSVPIVPNEKGFGIETPAGRGGEIYKVINLNPSGKGSLRECVEAQEPRICIFEISGTIFITQNLEINNPYLTIAGQTAPSPGITIAGAGISVQSHDILIQHLRVRVGDNPIGPPPDNRDAILIGSEKRDVYNVVIDHISASWAIDEVISIWSHNQYVYNISILNSIFSEGLYNSLHPQGNHSMGALIGKNSKNITIKNNVFAHNSARNPLVRDDSTNVIIANNLIYGSGGGSKNQIYVGSQGIKNIPMKVSIVGNVYISDDENSNAIYIEEETPSSTQIYLEDNLAPSSDLGQWKIVLGRDEIEVRVDSYPIWIDELNIIPSGSLENILLAKSGARPLDRDEVDNRIINDIINRSGKIIDSQQDVGGWPILNKNIRLFKVPNKHHKDSDNNGYTNLEELLHLYSYDIESEKIEILHLTDLQKNDKNILDNINNNYVSIFTYSVSVILIISIGVLIYFLIKSS